MKLNKLTSALLAGVLLLTPIPVMAATNSVGSVTDDINTYVSGNVIGEDVDQDKKSSYQELEEGTGTANVYATVASSYSVTIPKTIILDGITKQGEYSIKVNGNISSEQKLSVIPDNSFSMMQEGKEDVIATVVQDKTQWTWEDTNVKATGVISAPDLTAGSWNGSFNFEINLETTVTE